MAVYKRDIVDINLETGNIHRSFLKHSIGYMDQKADHFGIRAYRDGVPVDLTGVSVQGVFMPPQGSPIAITSGNIVDFNEAEVVLPQACYNYDGQFTLAIKLVDSTNSVTGTMRIVDGMVDNTHASGTVAPTEAVPTYQEIIAVYEDLVDALADVADYVEIFAPEFDAATANDAGSYVTYDGAMYLLPNGHTANASWSNTTKTQVTSGEELVKLKQEDERLRSILVADTDAIYKVPGSFVSTSGGEISLVSGGINTSGGNTSSTSRSRTVMFEVIPGYSYLFELTDTDYYIVSGYGYSENSYSAMVSKMTSVDKNHVLYHADSNVIYARISFAITADNTQAMTDSDRAAIMAALKVYTITDETLTAAGTPADAKATGKVKNDLDTLKESVSDEEVVDWSETGNTSYPTGWALGYYSASDGTDVSSNVYIRSIKGYYHAVTDATMMEVTAPDGYAVRAYEYKPDGTFVGYHGSLTDKEVGGHFFFEFEKESKFRFAMGKFSGETDSTNHYTDSTFLATCVVTFYVLHSSILEEQVFNISENLSYIFYEGSITYEADQWRTGYYGANDGAYKSSNKYLCTKNDVLISNPNIVRITAKAPEGYNIAVYEYVNGVYVGKYGSISSTNEVEVATSPESSYRLALGQFVGGKAPDYLTDAFIGQIQVSINELKLPESNTKLSRTGDFEWFTVTVDRPLAFGEEEVIDPEEAQEIECVLRLPTSYTRNGKPTRLILACHGASGYIQASSNKWYNSNWKAFMDELLAAGYAVFDSNVLPTSTGTDQMGFAVGSPLYVNVLKKAYDYIVYNYNVYPEIFAHGTSMGGVGATAFSFAYPELVLAESSFAGRSIIQYLNNLYNEEETDRFAIAYGYDDIDELNEDHFSHVAGLFPELSLVKVEESELKATAINGDDYCLESTYSENLAPDRETDYSNWLNYFGRIDRLERTDNAGIWTGKRSVPYKAWNCWGDNESHTKLQIVLKDAYNRGNACPYYTIEYDISDAEVEEFREQFQDPNLTRHSFMSYGMVYDMRSQLIAWYKRWE